MTHVPSDLFYKTHHLLVYTGEDATWFSLFTYAASHHQWSEDQDIFQSREEYFVKMEESLKEEQIKLIPARARHLVWRRNNKFILVRNVFVTARDHKEDDGDHDWWSLLALDHDDVVTELGLDRRVSVGRVAKAGHRQSKGSLLKGTNHGASGLEK